MKALAWKLLTSLLLCLVSNALGSAESENEPSIQQAEILQKAIGVLQNFQGSELSSRYNEKEKTSYYLRDASFLGRIHTAAGYRLVFRFTFIRSSPYREGASTPPRGHTFAVVFDDTCKYLYHRSVDLPEELHLTGSTLSADGQWTIDLNNPKK